MFIDQQVYIFINDWLFPISNEVRLSIIITSELQIQSVGFLIENIDDRFK